MKLAIPLTLAGAGWVTAPAPQPLSREDFLRQALVVEMETIDTGITLPLRVQLEHRGERRRAVFKSLEVELPGQTVTVGSEQQRGLRDSWKYEIAAYELDRRLGLGLVPVTVPRKIEDRDGALIDWVEDVLPEFSTSPAGYSSSRWRDEIAKVWLFDYLAYNIDRTPDNLLVTEGFQVRLIDHSRSFQRFLVPMRPLSRFPRAVIDRLRAVGEEELREALGAYLTKDEIGALLERRKRVLERVDRLLLTRTESEVLF